MGYQITSTNDKEKNYVEYEIVKEWGFPRGRRTKIKDLSNQVYLACIFYVMYSFISMFSTIGASTYLRKIAVPEDIAPSLAMGVTILHATAIVVPVVAGIILNFVGYQIPFFIACAAALIMVGVTQRLNPEKQRTAGRVALDEARLASRAEAQATALDEGSPS